ncbi:MAG: hypothetical protein QW279_05620, partial [Candidatus Jordarchaeaceae archaeon]
ELVPLETLSAVQMIVFALVTMFYIPCVATVAALLRELKLRKAIAITVVGVAVALFLGGLACRVLLLIIRSVRSVDGTWSY